MIGIDTNILIRFFTQDDPIQSKIATDFLNSNCTEKEPGFISHIVLCELYWVLESNYSQSKEFIINLMEELLQISQLEILEPQSVWKALNDFKSSNADFADHLIANSNYTNGCQKTVTFDKKAGRQPLFQLLKNKLN